MSVRQKIEHELKFLALTTLFFAVWLSGLILFKILVLDQYHIRTGGLALALVGAFIMAKVVLVLEHVPLGRWVDRQPPVFDLILRTTLYSFGALLALLLEKAFEARHEHGGFAPALANIFHHRDMPHVWANALAAASALFAFNILVFVRRLSGAPTLLRPFFTRPHAPEQPPTHTDATPAHVGY